jgi:desulfoferrodoxin-like iron-binding protein
MLTNKRRFNMRSYWIFFVCFIFLATALGAVSLVSASAADKSSMTIARQDSPMGGQTAAQEKPYTKAAPGPWSAAVAKKHSPTITYKKAGAGLRVTVKIDNHPMDPKTPHYIMWIRLEDGTGKVLGEKNFKATDPAPIAAFNLTSVPGELKAFEQCNIHGIWMSRIIVKMK